MPWIESPLKGIDEESHVFSQRHEASVLELFFDLFFVANLATFTTYHAITDWTGVLAYIGFFVIIWATWFQVTLHDTRFARDTIYERLCKAIQMISFVGFAVVSKEFAPGTADANAMVSDSTYITALDFCLQELEFSTSHLGLVYNKDLVGCTIWCRYIICS